MSSIKAQVSEIDEGLQVARSSLRFYRDLLGKYGQRRLEEAEEEVRKAVAKRDKILAQIADAPNKIAEFEARISSLGSNRKRTIQAPKLALRERLLKRLEALEGSLD